MIEHPDISAMMRYGTLEKQRTNRRAGFLYGFVYEKTEYEEEEGEDE